MRILKVFAKAGPDGVIRLNLPVGPANGEYELAVILSPSPPADGLPTCKPTPEELGWPPGYFENVVGSLDDETFMIHPQPPLPPPPEPLD